MCFDDYWELLKCRPTIDFDWRLSQKHILATMNIYSNDKILPIVSVIVEGKKLIDLIQRIYNINE
jgi:hypothetical protein